MAMKLSLAPIPYFWGRDQVFNFYARVARAPVDTVYLGETVCSKRRALRRADWMSIAAHLTDAGKEVVLSTLTLIEAESEVATLRTIAANGRYPIEANDMAAVNVLAGQAPFVVGPHINVYNHRTLSLMARAGANRWVMSLELKRETLAALQSTRPTGLETEVTVFGRLPLSFSARCFTARAHRLSKDDCDFRCADYPDGLLLRTRERKPFLTLNGIQVQSSGIFNLIREIGTLEVLKVDVLRLIPQVQGMFEVIDIFRSVLDGDLDSIAATEMLAPNLSPGVCDGYWYGAPGMVHVHDAWGA